MIWHQSNPTKSLFQHRHCLFDNYNKNGFFSYIYPLYTTKICENDRDEYFKDLRHEGDKNRSSVYCSLYQINLKRLNGSKNNNLPLKTNKKLSPIPQTYGLNHSWQIELSQAIVNDLISS